MLIPQTPFPQVGSYALLVDLDQPGPPPAELVRILERGVAATLVAFPLRRGAGGNKRVAFADLIDATELTAAEARTLHDLERHLHGRARLTPKMKADAAIARTLRQRAIYAPMLRRLLRVAAGQHQQVAA